MDANIHRIVKPHPPVIRALADAEKLLSKAGIKTIRWEPYRHAEAWNIAVREENIGS
jgi:hypothetical protein